MRECENHYSRYRQDDYGYSDGRSTSRAVWVMIRILGFCRHVMHLSITLLKQHLKYAEIRLAFRCVSLIVQRARRVKYALREITLLLQSYGERMSDDELIDKIIRGEVKAHELGALLGSEER